MFNKIKKRDKALYNQIHGKYISELKSMFDFYKGKYTSRVFESQWVYLPFYWFMKDFKLLKSMQMSFNVVNFVDETVNILKEKYDITISLIEISHFQKGYTKIINEQTLFKTVLDIEEVRFFEDYERLKKMKNREQKLVDTKLKVLQLYTSTKNVLNSSVLNVASYMNTIAKKPKIQKG